MRLLLLFLTLGLASPASAAFLQYHTVTKQVTGFRLTAIPAVPGRSVAEVSNDFIATRPLPAGCTFDLANWLHLLTVTNETPGLVAVTLATGFECFSGSPVFNTRELADAALAKLQSLFEDPALLYAFTIRICPTSNVTARCQALRAIVYRDDPPLADVGDVAVEAIQVRERLLQ